MYGWTHIGAGLPADEQLIYCRGQRWESHLHGSEEGRGRSTSPLLLHVVLGSGSLVLGGRGLPRAREDVGVILHHQLESPVLEHEGLAITHDVYLKI